MLSQRTFADLGTPLAEVTFCVVDLETTGTSPAEDAITEVGAVKVRRGEVLGTLQTLVGSKLIHVPAFVRLLTGISDAMLVDAPPLEAVLPSWLEFSAHTVLVAHNARFDTAFLNAGLERLGYPRMDHPVLDTAALARRILAGEVPNRKLETLVRYLRCAHRPTHRALDDALATVDVLHALIERVSGFGVTTLEDLIAVGYTRLDGTFSKITLAGEVPHAIGVYRFLDAGGRTLYVGKASDLRSRVRSYFYGDVRAHMRGLLRETESVAVEIHATTLEAEVAEARAIAAEVPAYNRAGKRGRRGVVWYLKVATGRRPRVSAARRPTSGDALYLGPFSRVATVRSLIETLQAATALHRCSDPQACRCVFSGLGSCAGPAAQRDEVAFVAAALAGDTDILWTRLRERLELLAGQERFEEAEELRRGAALLEETLARRARHAALVAAGDVVVMVGDRALLLREGTLAAACDVAPDDVGSVPQRLRSSCGPAGLCGNILDPDREREVRAVASWLKRGAGRARLLWTERTLASPAGASTGRFAPRLSGGPAEPAPRLPA